jgi:hypothetical protein
MKRDQLGFVPGIFPPLIAESVAPILPHAVKAKPYGLLRKP